MSCPQFALLAGHQRQKQSTATALLERRPCVPKSAATTRSFARRRKSTTVMKPATATNPEPTPRACCKTPLDTDTSIELGEAVALSILRDRAYTYNEKFTCKLTKVDGSIATISNQ